MWAYLCRAPLDPQLASLANCPGSSSLKISRGSGQGWAQWDIGKERFRCEERDARNVMKPWTFGNTGVCRRWGTKVFILFLVEISRYSLQNCVRNEFRQHLLSQIELETGWGAGITKIFLFGQKLSRHKITEATLMDIQVTDAGLFISQDVFGWK